METIVIFMIVIIVPEEKSYVLPVKSNEIVGSILLLESLVNCFKGIHSIIVLRKFNDGMRNSFSFYESPVICFRLKIKNACSSNGTETQIETYLIVLKTKEWP